MFNAAKKFLVLFIGMIWPFCSHINIFIRIHRFDMRYAENWKFLRKLLFRFKRNSFTSHSTNVSIISPTLIDWCTRYFRWKICLQLTVSSLTISHSLNIQITMIALIYSKGTQQLHVVHLHISMPFVWRENENFIELTTKGKRQEL